MQILIALIVMGVIATVATILVATAALIQLAPLLIAALAVVGALRTLQRRHHRQFPAPPGVLRRALPRPLTPTLPALPCPDGWVLVAVWGRPEHCVHRPPVVDAEVISVEEHHG
jgi:hypothetical protein